MEEEAKTTLSHIVKNPQGFDKHFMRYSYGVLTRSLLGFSIESADDPFVTYMDAFIDEAMQGFRPDVYPSNVFPFLRSFPTWFVPSLAKMERLKGDEYAQICRLRENIKKQIRDGTAKDSVYRDFLENRDQYTVSDDEAGFAFDSMIGGGTRSPHNALLTYCYLMMEYPEWQTKLQEEIEAVVGPDRLPTSADIPELPSVRAVVKEGIRYRSIKAELGIPHKLDEDDIYEGYFFPKGTVFHANFA